MGLRPIAFASDGAVTFRHDELGHTTVLPLGSLAFVGVGADEANQLRATCGVCGMTSTTPIGGGNDAVRGQIYLARTILRDATALGIPAPSQTWDGIRAYAQTRITATDGAARYRLGPMDAETDPPPEPAPALAVALMGQSNMNGYDPLVEPADPRDERIMVYENDDWRPLVDATDPTISNSLLGPGVPFARSMISREAVRVGLIPTAEGASGINSWRKGHPLYDRAIGRIQASDATLAGVLWYQGEEEAAFPFGQTDSRGEVIALASEWRGKFLQIVSDLRADLANPTLPVLFAKLAHFTGPNFDATAWATVQAQQEASSAGRTLMVDVEPATLDQAGVVHLDAASWERLGQRFATVWVAL